MAPDGVVHDAHRLDEHRDDNQQQIDSRQKRRNERQDNKQNKGTVADDCRHHFKETIEFCALAERKLKVRHEITKPATKR